MTSPNVFPIIEVAFHKAFPLEKKKGFMAFQTRDDDPFEDFCPNCGQFLGGESICPNCGTEIFDEEGLDDLEDGEGADDDEDEF